MMRKKERDGKLERERMRKEKGERRERDDEK